MPYKYMLFLFLIGSTLNSKSVALECGQSSTSDITLSHDFSYNQYRPLFGTIADKTIDACNATWIFSNSKNDNPSYNFDCETGDNKINRYPININGQHNLTFLGGVIRGLTPQESPWNPTYCNSSGIIIKDSRQVTINGLRVDKTWDGVRFARDTNNFTLSNAWISNVRDDCVENDALNSGKIINTLFDGCFIGISLDPGANNTTRTGSGEKLILENILLRLKNYPYSKKETDAIKHTHGHIFKGRLDNEIKIDIINSVFAAESDPFAGPNRLLAPLSNLENCSNNYFLWLSKGDVPKDFAENLPINCFTIFKGEGAVKIWQQLKNNWIACQSNNARLSSDLFLSQEKCDTRDIPTIISSIITNPDRLSCTM